MDTIDNTPVICVNDRYTPTADRFTNEEDFLQMCDACFGRRPSLTYRPGMRRPGWYDGDEIVLVEAE